jgi:hypothetical protein
MSASGRWPVVQSDEELADHVREAAPTQAKMFWRFIAMSRSCGPVTFEVCIFIQIRGWRTSSARAHA